MTDLEKKTLIELKELRRERSKTYDLGNGKKSLEVHTAPIHYFSPKGLGTNKEVDEYEDIEINFREESDKFVTDKSMVSVGMRTDKKLEKMVGLRYDYNHQFEFTPLSIKLDGVEKLVNDKKSKLSETKSLNKEDTFKIKHELNNEISFVNEASRVGFTNYVKVENKIESFESIEQIHLKGLHISNEKKNGEYIPDEYNRFIIVDENNEFKFAIPQPHYKDSNGESSQKISHELYEENDNIYYKKTLEYSLDNLLSTYPIYIDTSVTYYANSGDGYCKSSRSSNWTDARDDTLGSYSTSWSTYREVMCAQTGYYIFRGFFIFDTSGLPDDATIDSAILGIYGYQNGNSDVSAQKGTQADILSGSDLHNFSGNEYGHTSSWSTSAYNSITFNSTGKTDINKTGTTKICCREYTHDYLNSAPSSSNNNGCYFSGYTGTSRDPKLTITYTEVSAGDIDKVSNVDWDSISSVMGVAKASISKVMGVDAS